VVHNGHEIKIHDLKFLNQFCSANSNKFLTIFPNKTKEEQEAFDLLQKGTVPNHPK
jgi:hypothetical protein